ncbi:hypothetical protein TanjilG_00444 [Lupinus angustifolius]|uniref:Uncharacterized protein n=1 Tax=Lupinus angustifolius TaxID=3871 RepID=A0A394DA32_LUPAN|nr:hypothetical protein TanjilG_00444 [Lupinus angustifolius]
MRQKTLAKGKLRTTRQQSSIKCSTGKYDDVMTALKLSNYPCALEYLDVPTNKTIETLAGVPAPELALLLYLQCAEGSRAQMTALHLIIGTLQRMHIFVVENMDTSTHKPTWMLIFTSLLNPNLVPFHWIVFNKAFKKARSMQCCLCMLNLFWVDDHDNMKDGESHGSSLCISLVLVFLMSFASESCNGMSSFGFDIRHRFSDPVKGIMGIDELIEKGTPSNITYQIADFGLTPALSFDVALGTGIKWIGPHIAMQVIEAQPNMLTFGVVTLYSSLLTFTLHVHPDRLDYADQVLIWSMRQKTLAKGKLRTTRQQSSIKCSTGKYDDVMTALKLSNYPCALEYLDVPTNKTIETLAGVPAPELALLLYLQCAEGSRAQMTALHLIIGTLQRMHIFVVENMDTSTHKPTWMLIFTSLLNPNLVPFHWIVFNKAFKKARSMQCCLCMLNLFWVDDHDNMKDGERYASIDMKSACFLVLQSVNDCQCLFVVDD